MARELEGNWTEFTPHYIVWVCPEAYRDSEECKSQCIHQGRYCTPDPDGDLTAGYSGADIVQARPPRALQGWGLSWLSGCRGFSTGSLLLSCALARAEAAHVGSAR